MRFSQITVALLCVIAWMSLAHASTQLVSSCCLRWSKTKVRLGQIRRYTHQVEGVCPIKAVVFHTKLGQTCSDPNDKWTKTTIARLDEIQASKRGSSSEEAASTSAQPVTATTERCNTFFESTTVQPQVVDKSDKTIPSSPGPDPSDAWTTAAALKVDKEAHMLPAKGSDGQSSAATIAPTVAPTSKGKPKRRSRPSKRKGRRKGRSGRRWMKKQIKGVKAQIQLSLDYAK